MRQARAKAPDKDKHRLSAQVNRTEKLASKIKITERMLERLEVVDEPRKEWELRMTIAAAPRSGTVAASFREAVVSFDGFRLGPANLQVNWADRVAVTGPNGAGKSTLIGALLGRVPLSSGSASLGSGISVGEVDQARSVFDGPVPLLAAFAAQVPGQVPEESRTLLAKFGLKADHVLRPAASLSPGSGPGPHSRCCRRAGSTCSCSTSRPTTSTCPPSSSWSRRWTSTPGRSFW